MNYEPQLQKKVHIEEPEFDEIFLKNLIHSLDSHIQINSEMRMKYKSNPEKYVDSEVDLDMDIKELQNIAAYPELYPILYHSNGLENMIQLLQHPNSDIVAEVVDFFKDLVDLDDAKMIIILYDRLIKGYFFEQLVETIKTQEQLTYQIFEIIEKMLDIRSSLCDEIAKRTPILPILIQKIEDDSQEIDDVRLYATELLVIILQNSELSQKQLGNVGLVENLLVCLNSYRKKDPDTKDEKEIMCNICDALLLVLLHKEGQQSFNSFQGIQLMLKLITAKRQISQTAYLLLLQSINQNKENVEQLIDAGGLAIIFPILMRKGLKSQTQQQKIDETTVQILKQLFRYSENQYRKRVQEKCVQRMNEILFLRKEYLDLIPLIDPDEYDQLQEQELERVYLDLLTQGLLVVESLDIVLLECIKGGAKIEVDLGELIASLSQMIKYLEKDKEYYQELLKHFQS
ncbi:Beta-catenin-like protein 1 [Paramecium bursaria]